MTKVYWLLEDCRRYGTLPFAGLARAGFGGSVAEVFGFRRDLN